MELARQGLGEERDTDRSRKKRVEDEEDGIM